MFGGYPAFRWGLTLGKLGRFPKPLLHQGEKIASWVGGIKGLNRSRHLRIAKRALQLAQGDEQSRFVEMHSLFSQPEARALVSDPSLAATLEEPLHRVAKLPSDAEAWTPLQRMMYYRLKFILPEDKLVKVDRMSM